MAFNKFVDSFRKLFVSHKGDQPLDELKEYGSTAGVIKKLASDDNVSIKFRTLKDHA